MLWNDATVHGNYFVLPDRSLRYIYPKCPRTGRSMRVTLISYFLHLRDSRSDTVVTFKRSRHQGRWYWRDSRSKRHVTRPEVLSEVGRMLGCPETAATLVREHLG